MDLERFARRLERIQAELADLISELDDELKEGALDDDFDEATF